MECPYCLVQMHPEFNKTILRPTRGIKLQCSIFYTTCPSCDEFFMYSKIEGRTADPIFNNLMSKNPEVLQYTLTYPKNKKFKPLSKDIPKVIVKDYEEAYEVLNISPKSSAALTRRLLQKILENYVKVKKSDLSKEIQEVIDSKQLPSHLSDSIDAIRNIGNFAAHPLKSTNSGAIVEVEPNEAEWNLEVLEGLFDFYFVRPAIEKRKIDKLNKKLKRHNKPAMKKI